jgi:rhodanese-related sulfurtransferase
MSRRSKNKQKQQNQRNLIIVAAAVIALLIIAGAFVLLTGGDDDSVATVQNISPDGYQEQFVAANASHLLLDVRTPEEFASGHIAGAVNIPVESLENRLSEVSPDQTVVVYCRSGNRSEQASRILADAGYSSIYDLGGITTWTAQGYPVE